MREGDQVLGTPYLAIVAPGGDPVPAGYCIVGSMVYRHAEAVGTVVHYAFQRGSMEVVYRPFMTADPLDQPRYMEQSGDRRLDWPKLTKGQTEHALRIDREPPDGSPHVRLDAVVSRVAAVHARGVLDKVIADLEAHENGDAMWVTWPHRVIARALEDAINSEPVTPSERNERP